MRHYLLFAFVFIYSISIGQERVENDISSSRSSSPPQGFQVIELNANLEYLLDSLIIGGCVQVSNFEIHGPASAFGIFIDSVNAIGMPGGALLTTGRASLAVGPDDSNNAGYNQNNSGHPDLTTLAGINTFDATWIEFDFTPLADTIFASDFVFGSEEYPEYVNAGYNDAFGFFISGPGISGPFSNGAENIAWLPGTNTSITIDNVNNGYSGTEPAAGPCTNCQYYIDNSNGPYVQYDGFTSVISLEYPVIPGETYHFMIAIADAGDHVFDSGIFIRSESFCGSTWFQYAEFIAQPQGCLNYNFENNSQQADSYIWEFGDGTVSIDENPSHTYSAPGEYEVTLTCSNMCFDTTTTVLLNVGTITDIQEQVEIAATVSNIGADVVSVKCEFDRSADIQLSITDMLGRNHWSEKIGITSKFSRTIDVSYLKKGIYLMRIQAGNNSSVVRFVKM